MPLTKHPPLRGKTFLLVEDYPPDAELITAILPRLLPPPPPKVEHEWTLQSALTFLATHAVDLVILDLGLPDSTSPAMTLRTMRERFPDVRIVILSGHTADAIVDEAIVAGVPFIGKDELQTADLLARTIAKVLQ